MALYQHIDVVEARAYDGPAVTVIHDELGEQAATSGTYLLGTERGKMRVMSKAVFEAKYQPIEQSVTDALAEAQAKIAELTDELATERAKSAPKN